MIKLIILAIIAGIVIGVVVLNSRTITINMNCGGNEQEFSLKRGDELSCGMYDENWRLKIKKIEDEQVILESKTTGLAEISENGIKEQAEFILKKGTILKISTQNMNGKDNLTLEYK